MANSKDSTSITIKRTTKELLDKLANEIGYPRTIILDMVIKDYIKKLE